MAPRLLRGEKALAEWAPEAVLRIGGVPSPRFWRDLESRPETTVLSLAPRPFSGLARPSLLRVADAPPAEAWWASLFETGTEEERSDPEDPRGLNPESDRGGPRAEQGRTPPRTPWLSLRDDDETSLEERLRRHPASEPAMLRRLSEAIPETALLYLGNSLPIREWNLAASLRHPHPRCHASRGANGIDGQIATWLGLGVPLPGRQSGGDADRAAAESWAVLGDLTALYDLNAPALLAQLPPGRRRLVLVNNGGGRIFSRLPSLRGLGEGDKSITENRHGLSFEPWAAMWSMDYRLWRGAEAPPDFGSAGDALVCELRPDQAASEAFWAEGA